MWTDNFWADNFWTDNFWNGSDVVTVPNIILIDGSTTFGIILDNDEPIVHGRIGGNLLSPVQESYGGLIRLEHDFPYYPGYTGVINYESPKGEFGNLSTYSLDGTYIKAFIPDGLLKTDNTKWKFNIQISGTRNGQPFVVRSKIVEIKVTDGLIDL